VGESCGGVEMRKPYKRGYEDFDPQSDPLEVCPYLSDHSIACGNYEDYMEGWNKAVKEYASKQKAKQEEEDSFTNMSYSCPWYENYGCIANDRGCSIDTCAVWYFIKGGN
jgi:hypothetical protein